MQLPDNPILALQYDLPHGTTAFFAYYESGHFGRALSAEPKFDDKDDAIAFLSAYVKARDEFLSVLSSLLGRRVQAIDVDPETEDGASFARGSRPLN